MALVYDSSSNVNVSSVQKFLAVDSANGAKLVNALDVMSRARDVSTSSWSDNDGAKVPTIDVIKSNFATSERDGDGKFVNLKFFNQYIEEHSKEWGQAGSRGYQGIQGDRGFQGFQGQPGSSADNVWVQEDKILRPKGTDWEIHAAAFYQDSDIRLKNKLKDLSALSIIKSIPSFYYRWKSNPDGKIELGTSAQHLQKVLPELVSVDNRGYMSVDYSKLSIVAIRAIQELLELLNK